MDAGRLVQRPPIDKEQALSASPMRLLCHCGTVRQAARAITSIYDARLVKHGIRVTQFTILMALENGEAIATGRLSSLLLLDQTTLSRTLATLQSKGLVEAESGEDQRFRFWRLTPKGAALFNACRGDWEEAQKEVQRRFGKRKMDALDTDLYSLTEALGEV